MEINKRKQVLNLYGGIGGNRKKWSGNYNITMIENQHDIADTYREFYPEDEVFEQDAHEHLLRFHQLYDFVWSSPPCQSHTRMIRSGKNRKPRYPDLRLYEEILFLKHNFNGLWVVENVVPYYEPLIKPTAKIGRHLFWSNFDITPFEIKSPNNFINMGTVKASKELKDYYGICYEGNLYYNSNHDPCQVLRNCVHPDLGEHVMDCANI
jgi:DNA (cytosine-5)-methyltransferase 1